MDDTTPPYLRPWQSAGDTPGRTRPPEPDRTPPKPSAPQRVRDYLGFDVHSWRWVLGASATVFLAVVAALLVRVA